MHAQTSATAVFVAFTALAAPTTSAVAQEHMQMMMQPGAERMTVSIQSPANGAKLTGNDVRLHVATAGFQDSCDLAGKPTREGQGHYHVLLDKSLVNMFCTDTATVSLQNVKPGVHTLTVVPAQNDHAEVEKNARSIKVEYVATGAARAVTAGPVSGQPSVKIISPKPGATLSGPFDVVVEVKNFHASCDLFGKPDVPGYGHWHLNFDSMAGPMMGMMTMAGMSCTNTLRTSTAGLKPGSTHTLIALLANNEHAPLNPAVVDTVAVKIH